jgi:hypothetical protein
VEVEEMETVRAEAVGTRLVIGVRGVERVGKVVERVNEIGDGRLLGFSTLRPTRFSGRDSLALMAGVVVEVEGTDSATGESSDNWSSPGKLE